MDASSAAPFTARPTTPPPPELHAGLPAGVRTHEFTSARHRTAYLAAGSPGDPVLLLVHGWPEFGRSWVRVMEPLAALGFHVIAPDMRGYGSSAVYDDPAAYTIAQGVTDMVELLEHLGASAQTPAIVIGHDYGAPVAWNLSTHHPDILAAVAAVCVPYMPPGTTMTDHIDRTIYPEDEYPYGPWDYLIAHMTMPDQLAAEFDGDVEAFLASVMRAGSPRTLDRPARNATVRRRGGWFPEGMPTREFDSRVLDEGEAAALLASLRHTGFAAANSWYRNNEANAVYAAANRTDDRVTIPALFVHAKYDIVCATLTTTLADPLREKADALTEAVVDAGHWVAQEKPAELVAVLEPWLRERRAGLRTESV